MLRIKRLSELDIRAQAVADLREIFFLTSSRTIFSSPTAKEEFFQSWTKYYLDNCADEVFLAFENTRVMGYLTGCIDSQTASKYLRHQSMELFNDLFRKYPAHLHINTHPSAQGKGYGTDLIKRFIEKLKSQNIGGVHIVTSPGAANVNFYIKNGFDYQKQRLLNNTPLLFMGLTL